MTKFNTKPDSELSALAVKKNAKMEEIESLTGYIKQGQAILESAEPTEQMLTLLKSMEGRKARLEKKVDNYQKELQKLSDRQITEVSLLPHLCP